MLVLQGVTIGSSTDWDGVNAAANCSVQVLGTIISVGGNALYFTGGGNNVNVGSQGAIMGSLNAGAAINANAGGLSVTNAGDISGSFGVYCATGNNEILNSGHISGAVAGIHVAAPNFEYISNSGVIEASEGEAISMAGHGSINIDNSGTIRATGFAIYLQGTGSVDIRNTGHISGAIRLPDGFSTYDGSTGTIHGEVQGGSLLDKITTGAGRNSLVGGGGADMLEGGAGRDAFKVFDVAHSTSTTHDTIVDFDFKRDVLGGNMGLGTAGVDPMIATGKLRGDQFDLDLGKAADAAHLSAFRAVLFTPTAGSEKVDVFVVVDENGVAGYQAGEDFVVELWNPDNIDLIGMHNFSFGV
jgi:hypothetical protein